MSDWLTKLYNSKARALQLEEVEEPLDRLIPVALSRKAQRRSFQAALEGAQGPAIIAEVKRASPSAGIIDEDFDPVMIAERYEMSRCDAISVITESDHFLGELAFLDVVRNVTSKPVLRKDFIWTEYQVIQSAAHGADALLLIVAGLPAMRLREMLTACKQWDIDALVEVHGSDELELAQRCGARLIGINNRNLRSFHTDISITEDLLPYVADEAIVISESGFRDASQVARLYNSGVKGFLIGETFMRSAEPAAAIATFKYCVTPA